MINKHTRLAVLAVVVIGSSVLLAAYAYGVRFFYITSDSMNPVFSTGSILVTVKTNSLDLEEGDIVTVRRDEQGRLVTHRIVDVQNSVEGADLVLQGDANEHPDPGVYRVESAQKYVFHVF